MVRPNPSYSAENGSAHHRSKLEATLRYSDGFTTLGQFRVWLLPNPPLEFEPEEEVWHDTEVDGSHTLADFLGAIFDTFER